MIATQQDLFVNTVLFNWESTVKRATAVFGGFSDEQLVKEVIPGKNRVIYLLGHLVAVHDRMLPLLGLGDRLYAHLDEIFITTPDNPSAAHPAIEQLREDWRKVNEVLTEGLRSWTPEEWLQKHTQVSDEEFVKEPHRNRLNVVLGRTGHMSYHLGQLAWLKK